MCVSSFFSAIATLVAVFGMPLLKKVPLFVPEVQQETMVLYQQPVAPVTVVVPEASYPTVTTETPYVAPVTVPVY